MKPNSTTSSGNGSSSGVSSGQDCPSDSASSSTADLDVLGQKLATLCNRVSTLGRAESVPEETDAHQKVLIQFTGLWKRSVEVHQ